MTPIASRTLRAARVLGVVIFFTASARVAAQPAASRPDLLRLQVLLDRSGFSPGEIDGRDGANTRRAAQAYAEARRLPDSADDAILSKLSEEQGDAPAVVDYTIAADDVSAAFTPDIPTDLVQQASLPSLGYRGPLEALAEKFHASPALLTRLNGATTFSAGQRIRVPNVTPAAAADRAVGTAGAAPAEVVVRVSKQRSAIEAVAPDGAVLFFAPVTSGSEIDPLPIGEWKVTGVARNPTFHYNPDLFWDADPTHAKATLKPGPNNPVGLVWIDIDKPHYGLHGTPEPSRVGKTESHGCVRMTNWDALRLAALVRPGTKVLFTP